MYGSAGSHSAGSFPIDVFFSQSRSIGLGLNLGESKPLYIHGSQSAGIGVGIEDAKFLTVDVAQSIGLGISTAGTDQAISLQVNALGLGLNTSSSLRYDFSSKALGLGNGVGVSDYLILEISVPVGMGVGLADALSQVAGNITFDIEALGLAQGLGVGIDEIVLRGVPLFTIVRNPTSTEIEVLNREGKDVKIYRSDAYNISYSELTNISSDTFTDTGLDATKNYKYKLAFRIGITPEIIGQRSTGKYRS
jgi:hypothetical protein